MRHADELHHLCLVNIEIQVKSSFGSLESPVQRLMIWRQGSGPAVQANRFCGFVASGAQTGKSEFVYFAMFRRESYWCWSRRLRKTDRAEKQRQTSADPESHRVAPQNFLHLRSRVHSVPPARLLQCVPSKQTTVGCSR